MARGEFLCNDAFGNPVHVGDMIWHRKHGMQSFAMSKWVDCDDDTYIEHAKGGQWFIDNICAYEKDVEVAKIWSCHENL